TCSTRLASGAAGRALPRGPAALGRAAKPMPIAANIPTITVRIFFSNATLGWLSVARVFEARRSSSQFGRQIVSSPDPATQFRQCTQRGLQRDPFLCVVVE